jgi:hypothetical protein
MLVVLSLHWMMKYWTAHSACTSLPSRRQSGELEILLTTPLDGDAILLGSTTAIKKSLLWPFLFVTAVDGILLVMGWRKMGLWNGLGFAVVMAFEFIWFVGNLYSLTWVGLFMGMRTPNYAKALGRTLFCILFLPWTVVALSCAGMGIATMGSSFSPAMIFVTVLVFLGALMLCNLGYTGWAVSELRDQFRILASSQIILPKKAEPLWKSWLGKLRFWRWKKIPRVLASP